MHPHRLRDCRPGVHSHRGPLMRTVFRAALLSPYRFLLNTVFRNGTHLAKAPSVHLFNNNTWGEGDTELDAAQNKEVDRMCLFIREIGERVIVPLVCGVEAEEPGRRLVGFDRRFKDKSRLKRKVAGRLCLAPRRTPTEVLATIPDAVRFTLQYPETDYVTGVRGDMARLSCRGLVLVGLRNTWTDDQYKGINARWREPMSGLVFEVQFHTQASLAARELTHRTYERIRGDAAGGSEMASLRAYQRRVNAMVPIPSGAVDIWE